MSDKKIVYQCDTCGHYIGETTATLSPLEANVWMVPSGCVEERPVIPESHLAKWDGSKWCYEITYQPEIVIEPEPTELEKWTYVKIKRNQLIDEVLWEYQRHERESRLGIPHKQTNEWMHNLDLYVQTLADIPQKFSNPDDVVWPELPQT